MTDPQPSEQEAYDLEAVYDAEIYPLMNQIIAICQKHKMPMLASFAYSYGGDDGDGVRSKCTTFLEFDRRMPSELKEADAVLFRKPQMLAFTIRKAPQS